MTGLDGTTSLISLPTDCDALLFDDVLLVRTAQRDHFDSMAKMRVCRVEVVELHNLLTETMDVPEARAWLLDRKCLLLFTAIDSVAINSRRQDQQRLPTLTGRSAARQYGPDGLILFAPLRTLPLRGLQ
jgi:arginine deiminase